MLFSCCKVLCRGLRVDAMGICFEPGKAIEESVGHWMEDTRGVGDHRREAVVLAFKPLVVLGNLEVEVLLSTTRAQLSYKALQTAIQTAVRVPIKNPGTR